jgi:hypothetical protein
MKLKKIHTHKKCDKNCRIHEDCQDNTDNTDNTDEVDDTNN